jgi:hypothetical protein
MPWTVDDVERHNKGLTDKQKRMWVHVANGALESGDDDGTAITKANGVVKKNRVQEQIAAALNAKAAAMIEAVMMQQIASIFEWKKDFTDGCHRCGKPTSYLMGNRECMRCYQSYEHDTPPEGSKKEVKEGALDNQPEGVLEKHGWAQTSRQGDRKVYTHPEKKGHEIHISHSSGSWRHYNGDECVGSGFTGEKMRKHLGESVDLMEADPRPRVERDINGKPVVPNKAQYHQYFSDMHHEHIKKHLSDAKARWAQAAKDHEAAKAAAAGGSKDAKERAAHAAAHLKAVKAELSAGSNVLKMKQRKLKQKKTLATKKAKKQVKGTSGLVKAGANALFGKSRLATSIAKHVSGHLLQRKLDKVQGVNN